MSTNPILRPLFAAILVAVLQTGILGYMIESRASILRNGTDVVLKTVPVDPRDLLRGDYVVLSYDISTVPGDRLTGPRPAQDARVPVWVRLEKAADGFSAIAEASFYPLPHKAGSVVARSLPFPYLASAGTDASLYNVEFGIERYYVREGEGKVLEDARNDRALSVTARVDDSGQMQIRLIAIDGKPLYEEPLY